MEREEEGGWRGMLDEEENDEEEREKGRVNQLNDCLHTVSCCDCNFTFAIKLQVQRCEILYKEKKKKENQKALVGFHLARVLEKICFDCLGGVCAHVLRVCHLNSMLTVSVGTSQWQMGLLMQ